MFKEKLLSSIDNVNGTVSKVYTAKNYNFLYGIVTLIGGSIIYSAFGLENSPLILCQQSYMKATNEIVRYNEENPDYKIQLPAYNCTETLLQKNATGGNAPAPSELMDKITGVYVIEPLWLKICKKQVNSPLCKDKELLRKLYDITEQRIPGKNMFPILIGITNAESSLGLDFAKDNIGGTCQGRNNWGGTKYQILDNNTRIYKRKLNGFDYNNSVDQYGCNLYPFESIEEFWITKVNGMRFGYKSCIESETPIKCISYAYVGKSNISEKSWVNNVAEFLIY